MSKMPYKCSRCESDEWHNEGSVFCNEQRRARNEIKAAEQRGAERERAAVVAWLRRGLSFDARAEAIEAGKHREEE